MAGPLSGLKIIEIAGIGPGPMCAMLLADLGASVLRIDRKVPAQLGIPRSPRFNTLLRNRDSLYLDLKDPDSIELVLQLVGNADGLIEGFRPGTMERLGLGPDECLKRNPSLIYGRVTGWGQAGPLSAYAGHDVNYLALTGVLNAIGHRDSDPAIPLNLIGDYAGGSLYLAVGMLAAVMHAKETGEGQVVDAAIVDGVAHLSTTFFGMLGEGIWKEGRGQNIVDGGAPFYDCYRCKDGGYVSVGPIESKFFNILAKELDLDINNLEKHGCKDSWSSLRKTLENKFLEKKRDEWVALLEHTDACVTGILSFSEAPDHPHLKARATFIKVDDIVQPSPAPRFSRTQPDVPRPPQLNESSKNVDSLGQWLTSDEIKKYQSLGLF